MISFVILRNFTIISFSSHRCLQHYVFGKHQQLLPVSIKRSTLHFKCLTCIQSESTPACLLLASCVCVKSIRGHSNFSASETWVAADLLIDNNPSCQIFLRTKIAAESTRMHRLACIFDTNYVLCFIAASVNADWCFISLMLRSSSARRSLSPFARLIYLFKMH